MFFLSNLKKEQVELKKATLRTVEWLDFIECVALF